MGTLKRISVSLPQEMIAEIEASVEAGEYADTSEAIRDALRSWRRSRAVIAASNEELRRLVAEGRSSGDPVDGEVALTQLREKYARLVAGADD